MHTLRSEMEELMTQPDREVLVAAKSMISRAQNVVSFQADVTVSMPRLSVTRNPGWSVDGALAVQLQGVESRQTATVKIIVLLILYRNCRYIFCKLKACNHSVSVTLRQNNKN